MKDGLGHIEQGRPDGGLRGPEGDRFHAAPLLSHQGASDMPLADWLGVVHPYAGKREARQRVTGAERPGAFDHRHQIVGRRGRSQSGIDAEFAYRRCRAELRRNPAFFPQAAPAG